MTRAAVNTGAALLLLAALAGLLRVTPLWINTSASLPAGLYQARPLTQPERGELVLACLPELYAHYAYERGYLMAGRCAGQVAPIGKYVAAAGGDEVEITPRGISVNGHLLPHTAPRRHDGRGLELISASLHRRLGADEVLLANPVPASFDSRYFGVVQRGQLIARLEPLWVSGDREPG